MTSPWAAGSPPVSRETIESVVSGDLTGQQIVGHHNIQIGSVHGGVVNLVPAAGPPSPRRRQPVHRPPAPFPNLHGRETEVDAALSALEAGGPVEVHGEAGTGKTALLRHLGNHARAPFPEGVLYCPGRRQPVSDLLQFLFDAFYDSGGVSFVPTFGQVSHYLREAAAFVLIDDLDVDRDDLETLVQTVPRATFFVTSLDRRLWGEGSSIPLRGLSGSAAVRLVEERIGRVLDDGDRPLAETVVRACGGHPLRLIQAVQPVAEGTRSLSAVAADLTGMPSAEATRRSVEALDAERKALVGLLAALAGAPVHVERAAEITGLANAAALLESLRQEAGLAEAHSPRYSLTAPLGPELDEVVERERWADAALRSFTSRAEANRRDPGRLTPDLDAILASLEWAGSARRWSDVIRLGRAAEVTVAWHKRWGAWERVVAEVHRAALAVGDRSAEAWSLHQMGVRALCLDDTTAAKGHLARALELRSSLGEKDAALVTRFHLDGLAGPPPPPPPPPPPSPPPEPPPPPRPAGLKVTALAAAAVLVAVLATLAATVLGSGESVLRVMSAGGAGFEVEPAEVDFGDRAVGRTSPNQTVKVTNVGDRPIPVEGVRLEGEHADDFTVQLDTCSGSTITRSASCQVAVAFVPTSPGGRRAGLVVTAGSAATVALRGSGTGAAVSPGAPAPPSGQTPVDPDAGRGPLTPQPMAPTTTVAPVTPSTAPFAHVVAEPAALEFPLRYDDEVVLFTPGPESFSVRNRGTLPVTIRSVEITGEHAADFVLGGCTGGVVPPGGACVVQVTFEPESLPAPESECPDPSPSGGTISCRRYSAQVNVRTDRTAPLTVALLGVAPVPSGGID